MKQPLALILTDTHLSDDNINLVENIFDQAVHYYQKNGITNFIFIGDFFTSRKAQSLNVLLAAKRIFDQLKILKINFVCIPGNHDKVDLDSESSYLDVFLDEGFIVRNYTFEIINDFCFHFLPYFKESGEVYSNYLKAANNNFYDRANKKNILFTHIAVTGVKNNDGSVVENELNTSLFKNFDSVFVGHYHNKSQVGTNVHYIGSAFQNNFGEDDQKGFTILYDDGSHEQVQSEFPKYIKVKVDPTDKKAIKAAQEEHKHSKDNVRFVFEGEESDLKNIKKEVFAELGIDVKFEKPSAVPLHAEDLIEKANSLSFDRSSINKSFDLFCETKRIEDSSIGKSYLEKLS